MMVKTPDPRSVKYSVAVPFFNEEACVEPLYRRLKETMDTIGEPYELIFVDDGSGDRTGEILEGLRKNDPSHVEIVAFPENRGQARAIKAGFEKARGEIVISMDGDLQNDPSDIPALVRKLEEGYDAVCGWRYPRRDPFSKRIVSGAANVIQRRLLKSDLNDMSCTLRAYRRECLRGLKLERKGYHRFIPYLLLLRGARVGEVKVRHHPRVLGKAKYGLERVFKVPFDFLRVYLRKGE